MSGIGRGGTAVENHGKLMLAQAMTKSKIRGVSQLQHRRGSVQSVEDGLVRNVDLAVFGAVLVFLFGAKNERRY